MSRPDLAEIVSAVLAELDQASAGTLARGPGGRPEVPRRRDAGAPRPGDAAGTHAASSTAGDRRPSPHDAAAATPPATVAEAAACAPRGSGARGGPVSGDGATAATGAGPARSRPRRPGLTPAVPDDGRAAGRDAAVQRIVADVRRRLDEPASG